MVVIAIVITTAAVVPIIQVQVKVLRLFRLLIPYNKPLVLPFLLLLFKVVLNLPPVSPLPLVIHFIKVLIIKLYNACPFYKKHQNHYLSLSCRIFF